MIMMASLIAIVGYYDCSNGLLECDTKDFPGISHVMGLAPFNKLYSIMLTIYSFTKQAEARAYHDRLTGIASPLMNSLLLVFAAMSIIFGPCIGFYDVFYDSHTHGQVTRLFTIGQVLYIFFITGVLNGHRDKFQGSESTIDTLVNLRLVAIGVGLTQALSSNDVIRTLCEWVAFYMAFYIHYLLSTIIKYEVKVVPQK
jgi:hypothetical protein